MPALHTLPAEVVYSGLDMLAAANWTSIIPWLQDGSADEDGEGGTVTTASFIGIVVAISGNVLISLALNCQKLAHHRLKHERTLPPQRQTGTSGTNTSAPKGILLRSTTNINGRSAVTAGSLASRADIVDMALDEDDEDDEHTQVNEASLREGPYSGESDNEAFVPSQIDHASSRSSLRGNVSGLLLETQPLLAVPCRSNSSSPSRLRAAYGSPRGESAPTKDEDFPRKRGISEILLGVFPLAKGRSKDMTSTGVEDGTETPIDIRVGGASTPRRLESRTSASGHSVQGNNTEETAYLKSKLWWFGFLLMNIGELGNFISYGFAPASIVAPLGTSALIANCFFAPLMLKEKFRKQDLLGIALAILGAVTVVLSANPSDERLDPNGLIHAITQHAFIVLAALYTAGIVILVGLSNRKVGQQRVFVDVGACALFGGFTVLSTKAISTLLTMEWYEIFKEWITYPVLAVLIGTGVGQIRYLNRALMKFDSKVVIPTQFVLFNLSAIVGSAVLYGDFRKATLHQMVTFLYGCGSTFAGVILLTRGTGEDESGRDEEEGGGRRERGGLGHVVLASTHVRPRATPILRGKSSRVSLVGLSPAQRVLLVRTPSSEIEGDDEHERMHPCDI